MKTKLILALVIATGIQRMPAQHLAGTLSDAESARIQAAQNGAIVRDKWREIDGKKFYAVGKGWLVMSGKITSVHPTGIMIEKEKFDPQHPNDYLLDEFFISNFPDKVGEGLLLKDYIYSAREAGTYTWESASGSRTVRQFEYGKPCAPPEPVKLTPEQIAAQKAAKEKKQQETQASALRLNQSQAEKGDDYGQLRMGERYRDGDGVPADAATARKYFSLSAAQGNTTATAALVKLNAPKL